MEYTTKGTCSRKILFEVEDGKVHNVQFEADATETHRVLQDSLRAWT